MDSPSTTLTKSLILNIKNITKYLSVYAEPQAKDPSIHSNDAQFDHVLVVPLFDEEAMMIRGIFEAHYAASNILFIAVINAPDNVEASALERTQGLLAHLQHFSDSFTGANRLLVVDCCTEGQRLPAKQGVGLARKIGCDIATRLIHGGKINSRWIHSTDADAQLPTDYFSDRDDLDARLNCASAIYPFIHHAEPGYELPTQLYETSLHYYVEGLKLAGSPYGFHTIGSLLKIDVDAYVAVRGFPRRSAGEDFYLLNKLAKVGCVISMQGEPIRLAGRASHRVPFGTGPALTRINALNQPATDYLFYHPAIFDLLRTLFTAIDKIASANIDDLVIDNLIDSIRKDESLQDYELNQLQKVLETMGFQKILTQASRHSNNSRSFLKQFHDGFDGFKTLKFIHEMRNQFYPGVNLDYLKLHCTWFT